MVRHRPPFVLVHVHKHAVAGPGVVGMEPTRRNLAGNVDVNTRDLGAAERPFGNLISYRIEDVFRTIFQNYRHQLIYRLSRRGVDRPEERPHVLDQEPTRPRC